MRPVDGPARAHAGPRLLKPEEHTRVVHDRARAHAALVNALKVTHPLAPDALPAAADDHDRMLKSLATRILLRVRGPELDLRISHDIQLAECVSEMGVDAWRELQASFGITTVVLGKFLPISEAMIAGLKELHVEHLTVEGMVSASTLEELSGLPFLEHVVTSGAHVEPPQYAKGHEVASSSAGRSSDADTPSKVKAAPPSARRAREQLAASVKRSDQAAPRAIRHATAQVTSSAGIKPSRMVRTLASELHAAVVAARSDRPHTLRSVQALVRAIVESESLAMNDDRRLDALSARADPGRHVARRKDRSPVFAPRLESVAEESDAMSPQGRSITTRLATARDGSRDAALRICLDEVLNSNLPLEMKIAYCSGIEPGPEGDLTAAEQAFATRPMAAAIILQAVLEAKMPPRDMEQVLAAMRVRPEIVLEALSGPGFARDPQAVAASRRIEAAAQALELRSGDEWRGEPGGGYAGTRVQLNYPPGSILSALDYWPREQKLLCWSATPVSVLKFSAPNHNWLENVAPEGGLQGHYYLVAPRDLERLVDPQLP